MSARARIGLAALFAVVIPAASWLQGSGALAYRMYARGTSYRLRVTAWDADGHRRPIAPTALAREARGAARQYLAGSDHWLNLPRGPFLVDYLDELARLACATARVRMQRVTVEIDQRRSSDTPIETTACTVACP
jgi:hypothetical protein